jgi:predicted RND superfamily exporter protein
MWLWIAQFVLNNRIKIILTITVITLFMGYHARKAEISYEVPRLLPATDTTTLEYLKFKKMFGQDGAIMVIGIEDKDIYNLKHFNEWYDLSNSVRKVTTVKAVLSITRLYNIVKNDSLNTFENIQVITHKPQTQAEVDSIKEVIQHLPFYRGIIYNDSTHSTLMAITFDDKLLNTKKRFEVVDSIRAQAEKFAALTGIKVRYSGMPYIRSFVARKIQHEMVLFFALAIIVTAIILFLFFRSLQPVVFSLIVIIIGVIWSIGLLVLLGYKISALTGLIGPLLIVIGVPNCIMLLNKYHTEFGKQGNKMQALSISIEKVGVSLFLANITTAIGFAVFCSTDTQLLFEFGLVSSVSVFLTYLISLMLVPIVFSFLAPPSVKHTKHLESKHLVKILEHIDYWVHNYRKRIYVVTALVVVISTVGVTKLLPLGYVVDDLPQNDPILLDLKYFEKNYHGVLPFEISIDSQKPDGVFADGGKTLYKINKLQKLFEQYPDFSKAVSIIEGIKFANQAMNNGEEKRYRLPGAMELQKISNYAGNDLKDSKRRQGQFNAFVDSTKRFTRVSIQMKDVGSIKMKELTKELKPRVDSIFNFDYGANSWIEADKRYKIVFTGTSFTFLNGNDFLVQNLLESVLLAVLLISIVLYTLFMSPRMIFVSVIPSLLPLVITAGLMGFFSIYLKPSTILIFSIAFGIASDGTLYFLTKYRQELRTSKITISKAVSLTIKETGVSMIYTAIILFFGFSIFAASSFGGTAALGILISGTLLVAYCSNLILLPCFLLTLEKRLSDKGFMEESIITIEEDTGLADN